MTVSQATKFLEDAFDVLNQKYFESALPKAIITIQSSPTAYGHYTKWDAWSDKKHTYREINLGAETLNRPIANTIATLIHEMVHFYCDMNGIQDTSRGGTYHNSRFKFEAEARGLCIEYDKKIGHSITSPSKELKSFVAAQGWRNKLTISRQAEFGADGKQKTKKPSSTRKYVCPCCGQSVRATKEVHIACCDCDEIMQLA